MKVLVTGSNGQLGHDLINTAPESIDCVALTRTQLDIANDTSVAHTLKSHQPDVVINAAAYTAVDQAESDEEAALKVNGQGPAILATHCQSNGVRLIHLSTDYVFDGSVNTPYQPNHATGPQSAYGRSKLAGEKAIAETTGLNAAVVRVAWLYGTGGGNFVKTMLRLMSERDELGVVVDQIGSPTWTRPLAHALWQLAHRPDVQGLWHWSDLGVASWYDFSRAIYAAGRSTGLLHSDVIIKPISSREFPTPAKRPAYSVLDSSALRETLELPGGYWRDHVFKFIESEVNE